MPRKFDHNVLVIDIESTCWDEGEVQPHNEISEIIEVGLAVVDTKKLEIIENTSILVKPQNSKVSKFCTKLTTLTENDLDNGVSFQKMINILHDDYSSNSRTFISWGDYDRQMFEKNCEFYKVKYPFGPRHLNLKNTFTLLHELDREPGMDTALEYLKMKLDGTYHRGVDDARNIANILINSLKRFRSSYDMEEELYWRHKQDVDLLEHAKQTEISKNQLLEKLKNMK